MIKKLSALLILLLANFSFSQIVINELDADNPGTDNYEFIELKSSTPNLSLNGYTLVFINCGTAGTSNLVYYTIDLDGYTTDANGIFLTGCSQVTPTPTLVFPNATLQNGPDVVALYQGNASDFPYNSSVTTAGYIDGIAYTNSTSLNPTTLMSLLGITACTYDNQAAGSTSNSISRNNNGTYSLAAPPTPGMNNDGSGIQYTHVTITPSVTSLNEGDQIIFTFTTSQPVTGSNLIINFSLSNGNFTNLDFNGTLTCYIPVGSTSVTNTITVVNDTYNEGDEEMLLVVQNLQGNYTLDNNYITIRVNESNFAVASFGTPINPTYGNVANTKPAGYYDSLEGLAGSALKQAIQDIIANPNEVRVHSYADIWEILKTADQNPENSSKMWLIYTEESRSKLDQQAGNSIVGKWNREHIYCQSRGGYDTGTDYLSPGADGISAYAPTTGANDIGAGVSDAHHIRAVDGQENSSRNNKNYGTTATANIYNGPAGSTTNAWKGDVARACFYMAVRYNALSVVNGAPTDGTLGQIGDLATLLSWNQLDPSDDFEMNRNNYIYTWQHNRNPFIDYPLLADYIWGTHAGEVWHASLSTNNVATSSVKVYPIPAHDNLFISGITTTTQVTLYSLLGQKIIEKQIDSDVSLPISDLEKGIYILKLEQNNHSIEKRIIVD